jgi:hypothetical protein
MSSNRMITLHSMAPESVTTESWKFDSWEMPDSEALHTVLCIRDPGDLFTVAFSNPDGFPEGLERLIPTRWVRE